MIVYPENWQQIGIAVSLQKIEDAVVSTLDKIDCDSLSFSGGLDSSLLLYYLIKLGRKVRTFTVACSISHPDIRYSQMVIHHLEKEFNVDIERHQKIINNVNGDNLVQRFYSELTQWTGSIIAGDGIDEFMGGYYEHQESLACEETYFRLLRQLQQRHLEPLDKNSGSIRVHLPYLSGAVTKLLWQIPLAEKVDKVHRKKLMAQLAKGKLPAIIVNRRKYGFGTTP